jgi:N-acyl-D-aspartate/D-glutamate deacylase
MQGCTTVVTGNCGSGPVDVAEYYRKIDAAGAGTNVAHLLPQGALRDDVVGAAQRAAKPEELARMKELAAKAMREGAWGMSTGLIYVPSSYADTEELVELAKVVSEHGGIYASHIRGEGLEVLSAVNEALEIGRQAKLPVHISHFKSSGQEAWGLVRRAAENIEKARSEGQVVTADQYPYIASSTSLEATLIPTWARSGGQKELVQRLDDPEQSERIRKAIADSLSKKNDGEAVRIARYAPRQDWVGKSLAAIAQGEGREPLEIALEITRKGGAQIVNFSMSEDDVRHIMRIAWVATASDGSASLPGADRPHPRSYGTFARKIGLYSLREEVLPLAQAIRSASGLPADILGLTDRGYLRKDAFADVVVFDPKTYIDTATFDEPHRYAAGVQYVFVNGRPAVYDGTPTGALAGKALVHAGGSAAAAGAADGR